MLTLPDTKCVGLARHFLPDAAEDVVWSLALAFQEVAEDHVPAPHQASLPTAEDVRSILTDICDNKRDPLR